MDRLLREDSDRLATMRQAGTRAALRSAASADFASAATEEARRRVGPRMEKVRKALRALPPPPPRKDTYVDTLLAASLAREAALAECKDNEGMVRREQELQKQLRLVADKAKTLPAAQAISDIIDPTVEIMLRSCRSSAAAPGAEERYVRATLRDKRFRERMGVPASPFLPVLKTLRDGGDEERLKGVLPAIDDASSHYWSTIRECPVYVTSKMRDMSITAAAAYEAWFMTR